MGLTQAINPVTRVNFGFEWDNWSRLKDVAIVPVFAGRAGSALPLFYKDGFTYAVGAEYDWSPNLTVRAGVAYEVSPSISRTARCACPTTTGQRLGGCELPLEREADPDLRLFALLRGEGRILAGPGRDYNVQNVVFAGVADSSADLRLGRLPLHPRRAGRGGAGADRAQVLRGTGRGRLFRPRIGLAARTITGPVAALVRIPDPRAFPTPSCARKCRAPGRGR